MERRALIDERVKTLLTTTDLTFKQIIEELKKESISVSFTTIRRVNRNRVYRKPRYDAKLTPSQRKKLIVELINTSKPNLSSLARQYGVCHGSIWYWWDKLTKIKEKNNGLIPSNELPPEIDQNFTSQQQQQSPINPKDAKGEKDEYDDFFNYDHDNYEGKLNGNGFLSDPDSDPLELNYLGDRFDNSDFKHNKRRKVISLGKEESSIYNLGQVEVVGSVQAKNLKGEFEKLPILMFAPAGASSRKKWQNATGSTSGAPSSSSTNSTPSTSNSQPCSSIRNLNLNYGL